MRRPFLLLPGVVACIFAVLLVYSQTKAFAWDEGFHILAAHLIQGGKRPYLDFCFPQAPLNALWNAGWMGALGESWRVVHGVAAALTAGTVVLTAGFLYRRFPIADWRLPAAIAAALLVGLNALVVAYATIGQPYALCLFLLVAAYRVGVAAVERPGMRLAACAGLLASAAAASSLLAATAVPILLVWILRYNQAGRRWSKLGAFCAAAVLPFVPVLWWLARAPRQVFFNLVEYQLFYRRANWEDAGPHDLQVLISSLTSIHAWTLVILAGMGLWYVRASAWEPGRRAEFYLCGWLSLGIGAELCTAHPTFEWYFVLVVPFLTIPAVAGFHAVCEQRFPSPWPAIGILAIVVVLGEVLSMYADRNSLTWSDLEQVARKVDEVTPPGDPVWLDEHVYFLTRRAPAEGTEFSYAEVADIPERLAPSLHVVHLNELGRLAAWGKFSTVSTCEESEQIDELELPRLFLHQARIGTCHVFWGPAMRGIR